MKFFFACLFVTLAFVRTEKECRCSVVMKAGSSIQVAYEDEAFTQDHDNCEEQEECNSKCFELLYQGTDHGNFDFKPIELNGDTVGDYGCYLFGTDIYEGYGYGYSKLCDHPWMYTNFTFNGAFCCEGGKHVKTHEECG